MIAPEVKGYCPGALRPMRSGDGIVLRIRPFQGRLDPAQARGIAGLAAQYGNGMLDLSSRANIQIRGISDAGYPAVIDGLREMALLDPDAAIESRRNVIVTPFWKAGDETEVLASKLTQGLAAREAPDIPGKFGFAIDTGPAPVLQGNSGDIRLERDAAGNLILCADGADVGKPVTMQNAVANALALADWFLKERTTETRMKQLLARGVPLPDGFLVPRLVQQYLPIPSQTSTGTLVGVAFGQMPEKTLSGIAELGPIRMTPWRMLVIEGAQTLPPIDDIITDPTDPLLRVLACSGAPACAQGLAETRSLARMLAPHVNHGQTLHVSGCAKGCAHPKPATRTITATTSGYDLIHDGRACDAPKYCSLSPQDIIKAL